MDPHAVQTKADKKGCFSFEFTYVELLLAQPAIIDKLASAERKLLLREGFAKFRAKDDYFDTFGGFGELTSALVLGRLLEKENFSIAYLPGKRSTARQLFLTGGEVVDTQVINHIIADSQKFIK